MDNLSMAIEQAYRKDRGLWWAVARKLMGLMPGNDVRQIILLAIWEALVTHDPARSAWKTWAVKVLTGKVNTEIKHHYRKKMTWAASHLSLDTPLEGYDKPPDVADGTDYEEIIASQLDAQKILDNMKSSFSELEWDTLTGWMDGYTYREIAEQHGYRLKAVDNALVRVKKKSAAMLGMTDEEVKACGTKRYTREVAVS